MFKAIAAVILASLLAVMAYGIFWLVSLNYTTEQMKSAVDSALDASIAFGAPQWVPDPSNVTMDLPAVKIVFAGGPIRELRAPELRLVSGFLIRDRWTMLLPQRIEILLANGKTLLAETEKGEVQWLEKVGSLTLRADKVRILDLAGREIVKLDDVVLDRKPSDNGVRVNLASRPQMADGEWIVTGQMVMPPASMGAVVNLFGSENLPSLGAILRAIVNGMKRGGTVTLENVSFKAPSGLTGAVFGNVAMLGDGRTTGNVAIAADNPSRLLGWVEKGGLIKPRTNLESQAVSRFRNDLMRGRATLRLENMQGTLMLNGNPVGALPVLPDVVNRLWP